MAKKTTLPPPRNENKQLMLFETRLLNHGACRHFAGDFFELATVALVGGQRLRTHAAYATCPDIQWRDEICFECKSVGNTASAILYEIRFKRDLQFVRRGYQLHYWFWRHSHAVAKSQLISELNAGLAANLIEVVVVPFPLLARWLRGRPVKVMNTGQLSSNGNRVGWGSKGYGMGWGVPVSAMKDLSCAEWLVQGLEAEGEKFPHFTLFGHTNMEFLQRLHQPFLST